MHELGITQSIVSTCAERAGESRIVRVRLKIGKLTAVVPDAIRFCFDLVAEGTPLEGAALEIVDVPGKGRCQDCGSELDLEAFVFSCDRCQSARIEVLSGDELEIQEMEAAS